ncbi:scan domain-containing protein 3 [Plakobranchus ocellatus]|uniref:Scan domain-containing protein 3 n=1 Tax=Plakobranchus ocellatus TaxID=259542 RepID=A0AAV3XXI2_9GAST|nr:scan domain-containing protein 3 [Plakobranchus ocellatus]
MLVNTFCCKNKLFLTCIVNIQTPYFSGDIEACLLDQPIADVILGNINGLSSESPLSFDSDSSAVFPDSSIACVVTWAQALKPSVGDESSISNSPTRFDMLAPFSDLPVRQREDPSLAPWFKRVDLPLVAGVSFRIEDGVLKRLHAKSEFATVQTTIAVPESLRQLVLSYAHESDLASHSGFRKTLTAIRTHFSWPGVCSDVKNYTTSCHLCQIKPRTGRDRPAPLGFPKEIQSDRGQQFISNLLAEFNSLCNIKHFVSTPYHPQTNGIVERFHSTLKSMIRKLSHESPTEWNRFAPAALFAYRNQVHSFTGFSPFFLLFDRAPRGPMQILSDIFLNNDLSGETSFQYHYVIDLHNRIRKGWRLAQDSVRDSVDESRLRHEPKSKLKHFVPGDEVLVLLPTSDNKLVLSYKGPYRVVEKRTGVVYLVDLGDRKCTFHVNFLRKYKRSTYPPPPSDNLVGVDNACSSQAFAGATSFCDPSVFPFSSLSTVESSLSVNTIIGEELDPNHVSDLPFCETICFAGPTAYVSAISEENDVEIGSLVTTPPLASESGTVVIDPRLSSSQVQGVKELLIEFQDILTSVPGCANTLCHEIRLITDAVIRVKPYPLPFAAREFVTQEVNDLLSLGVTEPSDSPYCFSIVVVKKKDGSMRLCIDFRKLNAVTVFDAENIPWQEDLFNQLSHATIFSSCDLCKAYWQVPLHPDSRKYTAFQTPLGLMQWVRMPFGLVTAPATFCRLMRFVIGQTPDLLSYFDDTLVFATSWQQHIVALRSLLVLLRRHGLHVNSSKVSIGSSSVEFLGHLVSFGTLVPVQKKWIRFFSCQFLLRRKKFAVFLGW